MSQVTGESAAPGGHRLLPHTADVRLEAWAPTREACLDEAVRALAEVFVDTTAATSTTSIPVHLPAGSDEERLVAVLEEAIYCVEVLGCVPIAARLTINPDGALSGSFDAAPIVDVPQIGSVPKAITRHGLDLAPDGRGGWRGRATVDV